MKCLLFGHYRDSRHGCDRHRPLSWCPVAFPAVVNVNQLGVVVADLDWTRVLTVFFSIDAEDLWCPCMLKCHRTTSKNEGFLGSDWVNPAPQGQTRAHAASDTILFDTTACVSAALSSICGVQGCWLPRERVLTMLCFRLETTGVAGIFVYSNMGLVSATKNKSQTNFCTCSSTAKF